MKYLPFLLACLVVVLPSIVSAQPTVPGGFVPCQGSDCTACSVVDLANNIVKWLIGILMIVFAIITAYAGFGLVTSGGNPAAKTEAKQKLINAFIGLIIVLAAWILVDTLMRAILAGGNGEINGRLWTTISCDGQAPTSFGPPPVTVTTPTEANEAGQRAVDMATARCGTAIDVRTPIMPSANLCSSRTAESVISSVSDGGGVWKWNCGNQDCMVPSTLEGLPPPPGGNACAISKGSIITSKPVVANLCTIPGTARVSSQVENAGDTLTWICGFDPPIACSAIYQPGASIPMKCGTAINEPKFTFPGSNLCIGSPAPQLVATDVPGTDGDFNWECRDTNTGEKIVCSVEKREVNTCGTGFSDSDNTLISAMPPLSNRCAIGSFVPININPAEGGFYTWRCNGGGGSPAVCQAERIPN